MADEGRSDVMGDLEGLVDQLSLAKKVRLVTGPTFYSMAEEPTIRDTLRSVCVAGEQQDRGTPRWCSPGRARTASVLGLRLHDQVPITAHRPRSAGS